MNEKFNQKETSIALIFSSILISVFYGCIVGIIWSLALKSQITKGLFWGALIGVLIGLLIGFIQKGVVKRGNINSKESSFISGSFTSVLLFIGIILGVITWIVRAIFFKS